MLRNTRHTISLIAVLLGFSSFVVQLVLLRELLNIFMGNELVIGLILAVWMILTASGALLGRSSAFLKSYNYGIPVLLVLNGMSPLAGIFLVTWLKGYFFAPGVMIPIQSVLLITITGLAIFCLISGMMFTILAANYKTREAARSISHIYMLEAIGSLAGGLIFNLILIHLLNAVNILALVFIINIIASTWFLLSNGNIKFALIIIATGIVSLLFLYNIEAGKLLSGMKYPGQEVILDQDSPYGKITATKHGGQITLYHNGSPVTTNNDLVDREEKIHYAMALHPEPGAVLLMGGGADGSTYEIMKYDVQRIDYVDPDRWTLAVAEEVYGLSWPEKSEIHLTDMKRFLSQTHQYYDVILLNAELPATIGDNRFYTTEFFKIAKKHLHENGIFSLRLPGSSNYLDASMQKLFSSVYNSLENHFAHIRIVPGIQTYFLASDAPLDGNITMQIERKGIETAYVNKYYIDDELMARRAGNIEKGLMPDARVNADYHPVISYILAQRWLEMIQTPLWTLSIIPLLIMLILIFFISPLKLGLFTTGFTASSAEFLLLIAFQVTYGFVYQMAGIIIMLFMAGLAAGSGYLHKYININRSNFIIMQLILGIFIVLMPVLIIYSAKPGLYYLPGVIIWLLTFLTGILTGLQYHLSTRISKGDPAKVAASTYGADLAGSAFGAFFIALFIFPLTGLYFTCILLAILNFATAARLKFKLG